jgi:N-acetylglucosamine-6-sulfatase
MTNLLLNSTHYDTGSPTPSPTTLGHSIPALTARLDALLLVLKSCRASTCHDPWLALHPWGDVTSLPEALDPKFDDFYEKQQPKVAFSECELGYLVAAEGPQRAFGYQGPMRAGLHWSEFV